MNPSGLQAAVVLPTLADLGCLPLPCASGAAEASDSIGCAEQKKNSNTYLSTESGEVQYNASGPGYVKDFELIQESLKRLAMPSSFDSEEPSRQESEEEDPGK